MKVLIISSSEGILISLLRCLGTLKATSYVISIWPSSKSGRFSRFCKDYTTDTLSESSSPQEINELLEKINDYCIKKQIDVIVPVGLLGTFFVSKFRKKLTSAGVFPVPSPEQIHDLHDKWMFYQFLRQQNLPTPKTILLEKESQIDSLKSDNFPGILKPLALGNGDGVKKIDSCEDIKKYLSKKTEINELPLLLQEFVPGFDIILGILAEQGKIIASATYRKNYYFSEFRRYDAILEIAHQIISASNYTGVACFDIRFDERDSSFKVIECNPRLWASFSGPVYYGVDFVSLGILLAQGKQLPENLKKDVTSTEPVNIRSSWPPRFLKGLVLGKYPAEIEKFQTDLAWQSVLDPIPDLYEKVWRELSVRLPNDGIMLEKL